MNKSAKSLVVAALATLLIGGSLGSARGANAVQVPDEFTITGSGFGHGVGMSQYGAQGMGLDGFTAAQILTHYYTGTTVDPVVLPVTNIRVGLLQDRTFVAVRGETIPGKTTGGAFNLVIDGGTPIPVAKGVVATFTTVKGKTEVTVGGVVKGAGLKIVLNWLKADTVINVGHGTTAAMAINDPRTSSDLGSATCIANSCSHRYRYGTLEISSGTFGDNVVDLVVVNTLRLSNEYLYGLGEVPSSWTPAAMQAQAIAGRSYAVKKYSTRSGCDCQIFATTVDQAFVGYSKEIGTSGSEWVKAVNATIVDPKTAYVVRYKDPKLSSTVEPSIISTYYSSSTGGKSQPTSEVWGSTLPYLVGVDDHWSQDPRVNNSNSVWVDTVDQASLVARLRAQGVVMADVWSMAVTGNYPSGGIKNLNISDSAGNITALTIAPGQQINPDELRGVLGTKSTYISKISPGISTVPGSIDVTPRELTSVTKVNWPTKVIAPSDYKFTGKVSPAQVGASLKLQQRVGGKWKTVSTATSNIKGSWAILWTGHTPGDHQLRITATNAKGTIKTSTQQVTMAGSLTVSSPKSAKRNSKFTVSGSVTPGYKGVAVIVERKNGNGSWRKIATVKTDAAGKWSITRTTGANSFTVSYRAKTSDSRLGVLVSTSKTTIVK
jgi:SpoIID/LytB domain protein